MIYCDSSALVKLVVAESESTALVALLTGAELVTSRLAYAELLRAIGRAFADPVQRSTAGVRALKLLDGMYVLTVSDGVLRTAGRLEPPGLRTLDAIHLASALLVRDELAAFVSYDARQTEAAVMIGLPATTPR